MGKGSGICDLPGISLEAADATEPKATLNMDVAEINTTLEIQRTEHRWWTKDDLVSYQKTKEGWIVGGYSDLIHKAFEEYGVISASSYEHTHFPSLKAARQAVSDVSLEAGLNIDSRLTRQRHIAYEIGDLPLTIMRQKGHWRVYGRSAALSQGLKKHFNSAEEFLDSWQSSDVALAHYPTRKAAQQAVINWLSQTISKK